jgi:glutamyl-tRNA synthetase
MPNSKVRTRFAPSPTGTPESIHLGFVIRALWNYAYAKKNGGEFILRLEDTDQKRSRKDTEEAIYKTLHKFGFTWDEGPDVGGPFAPYRQSERLDKYKEAAKKLVESGYAYYDFDAIAREKEEIKEAYESKEKLAELKVRPKARDLDPQESVKRVENGEPYVVRIKIPEDKKFEYFDWILKKKISFIGKEVPDMILLKSDGFPTYHLAVVVDDTDMKISHVFRGQEWITSTPIHLYVYEGLQKDLPEIGHFTVVLDPRTKKKFSKRDMSAMFGVETWLSQGYLPEALLNYLMLLGWAPKDNKEFFTLDEFVQAFDQDGVQKANPTFDTTKLDWFNGQYIRNLSDQELAEKLLAFYEDKFPKDKVEVIAPLIKDRIRKLTDFESIAGYIFEEKEPIKLTDLYDEHVRKATEALEELDSWTVESLNTSLMKVVTDNGYKTGDFFMDLRGAIAGSKVTPPMNDTLVIMGKTEVLKRLTNAL